MIGEEVKSRRQALGLTGAQLAARADMAPSAVSQIETGKRTPSSTSVAKLAEALGVGPGELFPPKAQGALFSPDNPPVRRGADEAVYGLVRDLNEFLYKAQQAYAPGQELNWSRATLEEISALTAKAAVVVAPLALGASLDAHFEAVQVLARADEVVRLLDARAAEAPASEATGPPPEDELQMRREARRSVEKMRRSALKLESAG